MDFTLIFNLLNLHANKLKFGNYGKEYHFA